VELEQKSHQNQHSYEMKKNRLVPCTDQSTTGQCLGDRNTLLFTSRNTTDGCVSNRGVSGMPKAGDAYEDLNDITIELLPRLIG